MPRQHTPLFDELSHKAQVAKVFFLDAQHVKKKLHDGELNYETMSNIVEVFFLDPQQVKEKLQNGALSYEAMSDLLRETNDAQFGIISTLNENNEWLRDATHAVPLDDRISHDAPIIEANNALLRCLSRLRPIEFAINKKLGEQGQQILAEIREQFGELSEEILKIAQTPRKQILISDKEIKFNTFLIKMLHEANLTKGCKSIIGAENLLFHYRNLSSVLSPARTMITLTYDKTANILQRETQYPVTEKTALQKQALQQLAEIKPYPFDDEKNSHNVKNMAAQEADMLFQDLIAQDNSALSAQARKTHLVGAKNAFIVKNELIAIEDEAILERPQDVDNLNASEEDVLWLGRMGSPVFVGKGERSRVVQAHTRENLEQVRRAAAQKMGKDADALNLHVTTLNTVSPLEKQATIIKHVYQATKKREDKQDKVSYTPTNPDGTFRPLDIASGLNFGEEEKPSGVSPQQKATRLESVAKVMLAASRTDNTFSVVHCASGQDRTGTAVEKSTQEWMKKKYQDKGLETRDIESMRAEGGNAAEITSHHIHGSPGMKTDSIANNFYGSKETFSPQATREFYRKSAKTNKINYIDSRNIFLGHASRLALTEYETRLWTLTRNLLELKDSENPEVIQLVSQGQKVLSQIKAIAGEKPELLDAHSLNDLSLVLYSVNKGFREANDEQMRTNAKELAALANHVSGQASPAWKALGISLLTFSCAVLVIAGVLAAIPSGGSSLLLTAIGATGLTVATAAGVGAGVVATTAIAGAGAIYYGREKGLAQSVRGFRNAFFAVNAEVVMEEDKLKQEDSATLSSSL